MRGRLLLALYALSGCHLVWGFESFGGGGAGGGGGTGGGGSAGAGGTGGVGGTGSGGASCSPGGAGEPVFSWAKNELSGASSPGAIVAVDGAIITAGHLDSGATDFSGAGGNLPGDAYVLAREPATGAHLFSFGFACGPQDCVKELTPAKPRAGSFYMGGDAAVPVTLGNPTSAAPNPTRNPFVTRFGTPLLPSWSRSFGDPTNQRWLTGLAAEPNEEHVYVTFVGAGPLVVEPPCTGDPSVGAGIYFVALDATGACVAAKKYPTSTSPPDFLPIAYDPSDGTLVIGGHTNQNSLFGVPDDQAFVGRLDVEGNFIGDLVTFGTPSGASGFGNGRWVSHVAVGSCGEVLAAGSFQSDLTLDGVDYDHPANHTGTAEEDAFLVALERDPMGNLAVAWHQVYPDAGYQHVTGLDAVEHGRILFTLELQDHVDSSGLDVGGGPFVVDPAADVDAVWALFTTSDGGPIHVASRRVGGPMGLDHFAPRGRLDSLGGLHLSFGFHTEAEVAPGIEGTLSSAGYASGVAFFAAP